MLKSIIKLPDGTELSSGGSTSVSNIVSVSLTESVNSGEELTIGSVCANLLEATVHTPSGSLSISAGSEVTLYRQNDSGTRTQVGIFICEKPTRKSANTFKLTAYDRVSKLDKGLTTWMTGLDAWPYTLYNIAKMVCTECGVTLSNTSLPNGSFQVAQFSGKGITGRQLLAWVGEATGKFCRATADGKIEFAWYANSSYSIGSTAGTNKKYFFQGSLSYEDYQVQTIDKVQIQYSDNDVGVIYPDSATATNTYRITGNMLLTTLASDRLSSIAQTAYNVLHAVTYTPAKVSVPANLDIKAGQIVSVTDANGKTVKLYVMKRKASGRRDTLECTGSRNRDSVSLVNNQTYKALNGKVLNLQTSVEGLKIENKETKQTAEEAMEKAASVEVNVDGISQTVSEATQNSESRDSELERKIAELNLKADEISTSVSKETERGDELEKQMTEFVQDSSKFEQRISKIETDGVNKVTTENGTTLDDSGFHVWKAGEPTQTDIDHQGVEVTRTSDGEAVLHVKDDGVNALNVTVRKWLIAAGSRLEAYSDSRSAKQTGLFYIGGT